MVKYGGGDMTVWGCVAVTGPGQLIVTNRPIKSSLYQKKPEGECFSSCPKAQVHMVYVAGWSFKIQQQVHL